MNDRPGASFENREVVDLYPFRPPYPEAVFDKLREVAPRHDAVLDIGCGPGKVSRPLAQSFAQVVAVDPSQHMIALGQNLPNGRAPNLLWVQGFAEDAPLDGWRFDLTVAAASIHWMDHDRLFPDCWRTQHPATCLRQSLVTKPSSRRGRPTGSASSANG